MQIYFLNFILIIISTIAISRWIRNEKSLICSVGATVIDMRRKKHLRTHQHSYYVTFLLENGERIELRVKKSEYDTITTGCKGMLTYQGTRYKGFER